MCSKKATIKSSHVLGNPYMSYEKAFSKIQDPKNAGVFAMAPAPEIARLCIWAVYLLFLSVCMGSIPVISFIN